MFEPFINNNRLLLDLTPAEASVVRSMLKRDPWVDKTTVLDVLRQMRKARDEETTA